MASLGPKRPWEGPTTGNPFAPKPIRVYELAEELGVDTSALLRTLSTMGEFVRSASSVLDGPTATRVRRHTDAGRWNGEETDPGDMGLELCGLLDDQNASTWHRIKAVADALRKTAAVPVREVQHALSRAEATLEQVRREPSLAKVDRDDLAGTGLRQIEYLRYLLNNADRIVAPATGDLEQILTRAIADPRPQYSPLQQQQVLHLLMLSRPKGAEFWQIARALHEDLTGPADPALTDAERRQLLTLERVLHVLVPRRVFTSQGAPSFGRGSHRTTKVTGVIAAGLPSLGKRS